MKNILIIGATSAIAIEAARLWAKEGNNLFLIGRNREDLNSISKDLIVLGANSVEYLVQDLTNYSEIEKNLETALNFLDKLDITLIAHGVLYESEKVLNDLELIEESIRVNFLSVVMFTNEISKILIKQRNGTIAVIGSVAGDRGRQSNYIYGSSKAAVEIYLQGLRQKLSKHRINVLCIKPGFVNTPMTKTIKKNILFVKPTVIAKDIINSINNKKSVIYTPKYWYYIMLIIRSIPEFIFKKMSL